MAIILKTPAEIAKMHVAGQLAARVLIMIEPYVQAGISTNELDRICHDYIVNVLKAKPSPLYYKGYPKSICTSVNNQVCHGIPNDRPLRNGDIVNIDITVLKDDYHGDTSKMFIVGTPSIRAKRLIDICYECLCRGIAQVRPGARLGEIGHAIQTHAESQKFTVVREYCGHGIGRAFHEEPQVLHYGKPPDGEILREGMTFTIEPMINAGKREVKQLPDGWTVVTKDHSLSAQWEHTIAVTSTGCVILTLREEETQLQHLS